MDSDSDSNSSDVPFTLVVLDPILRVNADLGEGPLWDPRTNTLHFIDINEKRVYHYQPETGHLTHDQLDEEIGCLALRKSGGLACAAARGFAVLEPTSTSSAASSQLTLRYLSTPLDPAHEPYIRFNDGACDSRGRFFAGSVQSDDRKIGGALWRYDPNDGTTVLVDNDDITDSNGLAWTADEKTLYFTNSWRYVIYAYDYDIETGTASNRRVHIDISSIGRGIPDGLCLDSEGGIWSASWEGSTISRFTSEGALDFMISFPTVWHVTACCFGGPDLDQLFVTTAAATCNVPSSNKEAFEVAQERQKEYPDSGNLFVVDLKGKFTGGTHRWDFTG